MEQAKEQKGITLIALVITIVVLLILASITISFILSDGGIFKAAREAKYEQECANIKDYALSATVALESEYYNPKYKENGGTEGKRAVAAFDEFIKGSFPSNVYQVTVLQQAKFSTKPYDPRIVQGRFTITTEKTPDVEYILIFDGDEEDFDKSPDQGKDGNGNFRVIWRYKKEQD